MLVIQHWAVLDFRGEVGLGGVCCPPTLISKDTGIAATPSIPKTKNKQSRLSDGLRVNVSSTEQPEQQRSTLLCK